MRRIWVLLLCAACKNDGTAAPAETPPPPRKMAGVEPNQFRCDSIATPDMLAQVLGGVAHPMDSGSAIPAGVPHPCAYLVDTQPQEAWTFDFDCRDGYKQRADALFEQYRNDSSAMVGEYNRLADAGGIKPSDAGVVNRAPDVAAEVAVGAKGLDHHGQGLIFIDDDAPCYVRVIGPDAAKRLALAQLIAKNLTYENAPMSPRPIK